MPKIYKTRSIESFFKKNQVPDFVIIGTFISVVVVAIISVIVIIRIVASNDGRENNPGDNEPQNIGRTAGEQPEEASVDPQPAPSVPSIPAYLTAPPSATGPYRVTYIADGDTIHIDLNGEEVSVRFIGVDTPETVHPSRPQECFGTEASNYIRNLLNGKSVLIETDQSQDLWDSYGRLLAYVYVDGKMVNYSLIYDGYAYEYTYNMPYGYQSEFKKAQSFASENNRGLWSPSTCGGN